MYDESKLTPLRGLEAVRRKPGMYIGGTDGAALNRCVFELIANSIEEHLAGRGSSITVTIHDDGSLSVKDEGSGISVSTNRGETKPFIELALTTLYAGHSRKYPCRILGECGVGTKCVNAVSEWMHVNTVWEGDEYQITFARGQTSEPLKKLNQAGNLSGTTIRFKPDAEIFQTTTFDRDILANRLNHLAMLHSGLEFWLVDERPNSANQPLVSLFQYSKGIADFLRLACLEELWPPPGPVAFERNQESVKIAAGFQFTGTGNTSLLSFVNSKPTRLGGTHVQGFLEGLKDGLNNIARRTDFIQKPDLRRGMYAVIAIWLEEPRYGGAVKEELINPEVEATVSEFTREAVTGWAANDNTQAQWLVEWLKRKFSADTNRIERAELESD
jgi:DNA gyrase subunit B